MRWVDATRDVMMRRDRMNERRWMDEDGGRAAENRADPASLN